MTYRGPANSVLFAVAVTCTVLLALTSAHAATVEGTFQYCDFIGSSLAAAAPASQRCDSDGDGQMDGVLRPIAFAKVEIWHIGVYVWNTWAKVATIQTDGGGSIHFEDNRGDGTYGARVFATNRAAIVFPNDDIYTPLTLPFHREPGEPGPVIHRKVSSPSDVVSFSFNFTDRWSAQHYNIAEVIGYGFDYATARKDPSETDSIQPVRVYNIGFLDLGQVSHYNPTDNALRIGDPHVFEDYVILHEYAHFLEANISSFAWMPSSHDGCNPNLTPGFGGNVLQHAWMEGFADYFAQAVARTLPRGTLNGTPDVGTLSLAALEAPGACSAVPPPGVERFVASILWSLVNGPNPAKPWDFVSDQDVAIFQIFDKELDKGSWPTIWDFRDAWIARGLDRAGLDRLMAERGMLSLPNQTAGFVAQSVPNPMIPGQRYTVSVTMRNTGMKPWTPAQSYRLGSQNPEDNFTWGIQRVNVPSSVAPGQQVTFSFALTAPTTSAAYNFQWRMLQEGVEWFGDFTPNVLVGVHQPARTLGLTVVQGQMTDAKRTITVWANDAVTGAPVTGRVIINGATGATGRPITYKSCTRVDTQIEIVNGKPHVIETVTLVACEGQVQATGYSNADFVDSFQGPGE